MRKVGVGLQANLIRPNAVVADAQVVQFGGAEYPRIADADVLRAKLGSEGCRRACSGLLTHVEGTIT